MFVCVSVMYKHYLLPQFRFDVNFKGTYCSEPILCPRLCGTLSSSYSSLDPFCYDYQLTCLYLVRQSVYISMSTCNIFSLILVLKLSTSLHSAVPPTFLLRSADVPPPFCRLATTLSHSVGNASLNPE